MEFSSARQQAILDAVDAVQAAHLAMSTSALAERLGISEGEVQASRLGRDVWTLPMAPCRLANHLAELGDVRVVTGSAPVRLAQTGRYPAVVAGATALDADRLAMRWQPRRWHWACLVRGEAPLAPWRLQLFDPHGRYVHGCAPRNGVLSAGWRALVAMRSATPPAFTRLSPLPRRPLPAVPGLAAAWAMPVDDAARDALLGRYRLERHEALALLEGHFTHALPAEALPVWLAAAADWGVPVTISVATVGCRQAAVGRIARLRRRGRWLVVTGESCALRLDMTAVARLWQVSRPALQGGALTSLEAFDGDGQPLVTIAATQVRRRTESPASRPGPWEAIPRANVA